MSTEPRWLDAEQQQAWRSYLMMTQLLDSALDRQLQRDANMPQTYFGILVSLSEAPNGELRMSEISRRHRFSRSRLTHAVTSMETKGWIVRERCGDDRRGFNAVITDAGLAALRGAAPGHVAEVRRLLFDRLDATQLAQFGALCNHILAGLDDEAAVGVHHEFAAINHEAIATDYQQHQI